MANRKKNSCFIKNITTKYLIKINQIKNIGSIVKNIMQNYINCRLSQSQIIDEVVVKNKNKKIEDDESHASENIQNSRQIGVLRKINSYYDI